MQDAETVGEAWLQLLADRGVDFLFANSGTDFPSIVEGLARAEQLGTRVPRAVIAPHENAAVSMAHGHAMVSGRAQAVMVHVNVGTANAVSGLLNADRDYVPMLLAAGRTPVLEGGAPGARSLNIHWAQEMFDQAGMVREAVKWDYELRDPRQLIPATDRALALAHSAPRGPVYLSLPRELLAMPPAEPDIPPARLAPVEALGPDPRAVAAAAAALSRAERPLIVTARAGADRRVPALLSQLAARLAAPVVEYRPRHLNLSTDDPLHGGFEVSPHLATADVVLVLDCDVPWIPDTERPAPGATIIQAGEDPLQARYVSRGFPADITLRASAAPLLQALLAELGNAAPPPSRRTAAEAACQARRTTPFTLDAPPARMSMGWVSFCLDQLRAPDSLLVNEYPLHRGVMRTTEPGSFFGSSPMGSLGWGLPAALGAKLAAPNREVIAALGDGCLIFANPVACHQIAAAENLAILVVVFNNRRWGAVDRATRALYPDGFAARANRMPLTSLEPAPDHARIAEACGLYGRGVADPAALPAALRGALAAVRAGRSALLDVLCDG
ncbi:thiamine pyrophosphate-requiring protein [Roseomonas sp. BN140053]|uniref:thiamine pyrophosphate-requiring protein n=1 Tax=Roseomonas sp. BN140053 TaxID=3391898 RepID=UPI0039E9312F